MASTLSTRLDEMNEDGTLLKNFLHFFASNPLVYDKIQNIAGFKKISVKIYPYLIQMAGSTVLDVGAGTGNCASLLPLSAKYVWLDIDRQKLEGFLAKRSHNLAILGDATHISVKDKSIDYAICIALTHHLSDSDMDNLFRELNRVVKYKIIYLDPVMDEKSIISNVLWRYDRGSHPRYSEEIINALNTHLKIEHADQFKIFHKYILCICIPN